MSWNVLITTPAAKHYGIAAQNFLRDSGCKIFISKKPGWLRERELKHALPKVDAIIASLDEYSAAVISSPEAARLKIIARWGVGYDKVDLDAATRNGIV